jgi:2-dehydropantoate 2-reductase
MRAMAEPLQFVVVGAGNMGCVYGGNLARIGQKVAFVDVWKDHVEAIRERGLRLEGLTGDFTARVQASTDAAEAPPADAVLICVNTYSTADAARAAHRVLKPGGYCLTLQNGVGNVEILEEVLGKGRVLAGLSFQSGDLRGPGHMRHTNNGPTYLGELDRSRTPRLALLNELLQSAGMNPVLVDDVMRTIWTKFIHNCGINAICALTGLRPGHIREVPDLDEFQTGIIREALALVRAKGIEPTEPDPVAAIKEYCSHKFHRPSMMQHLDRRQPTEIDALNGYVARESRRLGLAAPCNDALTRLVRGRQHVPIHPEAVG